MNIFILYAAVLLLILHTALSANIFLTMLAIFLFGGAIIGFTEYKHSIADLVEREEKQMEKEESAKRKLSFEEQELDGYISELRQKEIMIVKLYEITKNMSQNLTFSEIFHALSVFLTDNFMFRKAGLLILKEAGAVPRVEKEYQVYKEDEETEAQSKETTGIDHAEILNIFAKDKKEIFIARENSEEVFEKLRLNKEVKTLSAMPLLSEKRFVGVLIIENLSRIDFDKLVIVAMQFALEIKKVLLYEKVEGLAITDGLTGLYTRRYFFERLNEELSRSKRHSFSFSFLMIDIDAFKACNDTYGHLVGDIILRDVARLTKESVREIDLVARYGGEEFSLVLPETDKKSAHLAAERIRKKIDEHIFKTYDEKLKITVSIGLAVYPEDSLDASELIEKADKALYLAKGSGKNIVCEYRK